ncbi:MAG TPA: hypothetical protein VMB34_31130 [Acetobacteraceae bacterium]|nr:hypothetical protein [Acetobacteraceae bacterium]
MDNEVNAVDPAFEEPSIGFEFERIGRIPLGVGNHPILGDDGVAFYAAERDRGII